jgi:hypothetical protein
MKTLQNQYTAITEGKGNKDHFLKQARHLFPELLTVNTTFNDAITILKGKNILTEAVGGIVTQNPNKPDWFKIFNTNIKEAVGVKDKKEYGDQNTFEKIDKDVAKDLESNFDNSNPKNIDNVYGQSFLIGYLAEMDDPKNAEKTVDELKQIVAKNMAKDINYYAKNGMFAVKGIGLETSTEPKAPKGKYKSSGYGDLKESYDYETQKDLKALAQDSNKLKDSNEVKKAAKFIGMNADDEDELGRLTKAYAKKHEITDSEAITHIIDQAYTIFKSRFSEMNEGLKKAFNKKLRESETRSVGPMIKSKEFKVGDKVKYKGMNHEITRIVDDRIYIKNLKYGGRPDTWVKASDLKENKENKPENPYSLYKSHPKFKEAEQAIAKALKTATKREDVENILKNYREAGADDTASREAIFAAFNKKLNESKLRSLVRNLIKEELN